MNMIKHDLRRLMLYEFKLGHNASEASANINRAWGEESTRDRTVRRWFGKFRSGDKSLKDEEGRGRLGSLENEQLHAVVEQNPRQSVREMSQTLGVSIATVSHHLKIIGKVIECELHAIHEALSWISENSAPSDKYVIFTDSLSSLYLIPSTKPKYYIPLVYNIQNKLINIISSHCIRLQFIPGHRGVSGNKAADSTAKAAHLLRYRTLTPYSKEETVSLACKAFRIRDSTWLQQVRVTDKVLHLVQIRDTYGSWPWASHRNRRVETALARLRVGHTGWNTGNIVNKGKINLPSDLGLHGLVFEAPNKHDTEEEEEDFSCYLKSVLCVVEKLGDRLPTTYCTRCTLAGIRHSLLLL
ncbi:Ribonuclease H domain [Trinorchestia longiramus]|nr:Ribonuclease H domain [Trinorchestia longiramus]